MRFKMKSGLIVLTLTLFFAIAQRAVASENIELAGDLVYVALPLTAWGVSHFGGDDEGFYQFTTSLVATAVGTEILKQGFNETRPNGEPLSFPSGHASLSFSAASFLHKRYGLSYGIPAYIAATFVGWSRVESNQHYPRDVVAGAALAIGFNHYFVTPQKESLMAGVTLGSESGTVGLNISGRW